MDKELFLKQKNKILEGYSSSKGIGTLSEKTLHKIIKFYYEGNEAYHEISVDKFYADILKDNRIYEIQTRAFNKLRSKLDVFLPLYQTWVVYPIPHNKWLYWINQDTLDVSKKRKSPKVGTIYDCFFELYKIKPYLTDPNFIFTIMLIDVDEYRNLDGWNYSKKKGSTRFDRIPKELIDEITFTKKSDYKIFLPENLPTPFTSTDFKMKAKINIKTSRLALNILSYLDVIEKVGKDKKTILYKIKP